MAYFDELFVHVLLQNFKCFVFKIEQNYVNISIKSFSYNTNNIFLKAIEHLGYYDLPLYKTRFQVVQILIKAASRL